MAGQDCQYENSVNAEEYHVFITFLSVSGSHAATSVWVDSAWRVFAGVQCPAHDCVSAWNESWLRPPKREERGWVEKDVGALVQEIRQESEEKSELTQEELEFEARRTIYYGTPEENELYIWTIPEIRRQITYYQKLLEFGEIFEAGEATTPEYNILETWPSYAKRFPGKIELGIGTRKIFEVRDYYDDWTFMDEFFTKEFCERNKYFLVKQKTVWDWRQYPNQQQKHWIFETRAFKRIRGLILFRFTNFHKPLITVDDANYNNNSELFLRHHHDGVDLDWWSKDQMYVKDVLERLFHIWGGEKDVHIETIKTKTPEDRPWWFTWHQTKEKSADEPDKLTGDLVIFSYGKDGFRESVTGTREYTSPF
ncbi:MAG: SpoVR family protein [Acidobacteria bacterium]|nr:SpoVR family protein [Acidobacteriota bacterium]